LCKITFKYEINHKFNKLSLLGQVLCSKNGKIHLHLPIVLEHNKYDKYFDYVIWKINIKKILSKDCFIKFTIKNVSLII
jgi:hypothetical protein